MKTLYKEFGENFELIEKHFNDLNRDLSHFVNRNDICTPMGLVKEMIDSIPKSFWSKQSIKVLDPCVGNGNFLAYAGIKTNLDNLYFNEINNERIENVEKYFGKDINLSKIDFLKFEDKEEFDLVVANPPYAKFNNGKRVSKNHNLAREFILKALNVTKKNGYILFVVPNNWMSFSDINKLPSLMSQYQFIEINIHGPKKYFPNVGSTFTWFLLKKSPNKKPVKIKNYYKLIDENNAMINTGVNFIPLYYSDIVRQILDKVIYNDNPKYNVITSSEIHRYTKADIIKEEKTEEFKYKLIHTPSQTLWTSKKHKYYEDYKVFIPLTNQYKLFVENNCGATQSIAYVPFKSKNEATKALNELSDEIYKFVANITRYGNFNNVRVLQNFTKLEYIKLTNEEKELIKKFNNKYYDKNKKFKTA